MMASTAVAASMKAHRFRPSVTQWGSMTLIFIKIG